MSVYGLDCSEQDVRAMVAAWGRHFFFPSQPVDLENDAYATAWTLEFNFRSVGDNYTLLSVNWRPKAWRRIFAVLGLLAGFVGWQMGITLFSRAPNPVFGVQIVYPVLIFGGLVASFFYPLWSLGVEKHLGVDEADLVARLREAGTQVDFINVHRPWRLFPSDVVLFEALFVAVSIAQLLAWLHDARLIAVAWLTLLVAVAGVGFYVCIQFAKESFVSRLNAHAYWKLQALILPLRASVLLMIPVVFYAALVLLMHVSLGRAALTVTPRLGDPSLPDNAKAVLTFDVAAVLGHLERPDVETAMRFVAQQQAVGFIMLLIAVLSIPLTLSLISSLVRIPEQWRNEWGKWPHSAATTLTLPSESRLSNIIGIWAWLMTIAMNTATISIIGLGSLWILGKDDWLPLGLQWPLIWYQAQLESALGEAGRITAYGVAVILSIPMLFWLAIWAWWIGSSFLKALSVAIRRQPEDRVRRVLDEVCRRMRVSVPFVSVQDGLPRWPELAVVLPSPRFCVLYVWSALLPELSEKRLKQLMAHELAHSKLHSRKLWFAQVLSAVGLVGGYLTLLLDYRKMEFDADKTAASMMGSDDQYAKTLEALPEIMDRAILGALVGKGRRGQAESLAVAPARQRGERTLWYAVQDVYELYFGAGVWGSLHPSLDERVYSLYGLRVYESYLEDAEVELLETE